MNGIVMGKGFDPYHNLAVEESLFSRRGEVWLYLWQNASTVVIGRHQNAWRECRTELMESEDCRLARRTTGGGAVYHDLGNLNFTFVAPVGIYDIPRQMRVIQSALNALGIDARCTGRNDMTVEGKKCSGSAFRKDRYNGMHHGTLLVDVDMDRLSRYLAPSKAKLEAKGVKSVRARVCNLIEYAPDLDIPMLQNALREAFVGEYGEARVWDEGELDADIIAKSEALLSSWEWRCGRSPACDVRYEKRFEWGEVSLELRIEQGIVVEAEVYSDANDEAEITKIKNCIAGCEFKKSSICGKIGALGGEMAEDISNWLAESD